MKRLLILTFFSITVFPITQTPVPLPSPAIDTKEKEKNPTPQTPSLTPQMRMIAREYFSLACTCVEEEKYEKAISYFQEVIKRTPENIEALAKLGELSEQLHRYNHAIEYYKKIIEIEPNNTETHTHLGTCYFHIQKLTDAKNHLNQALNLQPKQCKALFFLGMICEKEKQFVQAITHYQKALTQQPSFDVYYHLGTAYSHLSQWANAVSNYEKAVEIDPKNTGALIALANAYNLFSKPEKAIPLYEKVLADDPQNTTVRYNYGFTLKQQGKLEDAIAIYQQVLKEQPDYALAHFSLALTHLALGNFTDGLIEYEWRSKLYKEPLPEVKAPRWQGQPLSKRSILLVAEQGLSDTLQFIRYTHQLKRDGAFVILMAQDPLISLLSLCPTIDKVISIKDEPPLCDYWLPLMSLPLQYKTTLSSIPVEIPYLKSPPHINAYWRSYLAEDALYKVGICWQGNDLYSTQQLNHSIQLKSIPLKMLMRLGNISGITIYSLQQQLGMEQIADLDQPKKLHTFDASFDVAHGRFMDSAAVINNLDLIISVDTAIAHLAGALGKRVWLLLPTPSDWRWLTDRNDSPWYPSMRIFRQKNPGDWNAVIDEISKELTVTIQNKTICKDNI